MKLLVLVVMLFSVGCTDAEFSRMMAFGETAHVLCYSGGTVIYDGQSSGKVLSEEGSDGYFFKEKDTGRVLEVTGNCIISYED